MKNRLEQSIMIIDAITESPSQREERLAEDEKREEARLENLDYKEARREEKQDWDMEEVDYL